MGLRSRLLEIPIIYELLQNGLARPDMKSWLVADVIKTAPGMKVLDVGCGTANILSELHNVSYLGVDHNPKYLDKARSRFGTRGRFEVSDVNDSSFAKFGTFDCVLLLGVMHHLNDGEIKKLMTSLSKCLTKDGFLVTFDNAIIEGQHPIARFLAKADRGRFSRSPENYRRLLEPCFRVEREVIRHDLLRVPYTHVAFRCFVGQDS